MSNWDLMMPGMGLTGIGLTGIITSYSGLAHTFIDGMHALTGLTLFIGLIILAAGIMEGGVSTSNRAKATVLVVAAISLSFAAVSLTSNTIDSVITFAGVMLVIAIPSIVIAYVGTKHKEYMKPIATIFLLAVGAGVLAYIGFGFSGPEPYLVSTVIEEVKEEIKIVSDTPIFSIAILEGAAINGNPDYLPDEDTKVTRGEIIEWINEDAAAHTATSFDDLGDTFDSGLLSSGDTYQLDTTDLPDSVSYFCTLHPWMESAFAIVDDSEATTTEMMNNESMMMEEKILEISIPQGAGIPGSDKIFYDPEEITIDTGDTITWTNNDITIHTVTSGMVESGHDGIFDSSIIGSSESFEYTFDDAGYYPYYCVLHPWMLGSVTAE
ncbi:MAG: plastocyanin/azurin family copper-binding protein [Candidatus Nitrosoabyssus spongiisocia]|nr:MAG: plastocyanin/azurin family copper-binding protein [Nitrosopumilaceae archaeon AB1(1)]